MPVYLSPSMHWPAPVLVHDVQGASIDRRDGAAWHRKHESLADPATRRPNVDVAVTHQPTVV